MNLNEAIEEKEYIVKAIDTDDEELISFLFSLGCYEGEKITVISNLKVVLSLQLKMEDII